MIYRITQLVFVLPPYLIGSMLTSIFCLIFISAAVYDGDGVPLGIVVGVFASMGVLAVLCFRLAEPRILARMLRNAVRDNGASSGVVARTSPEPATRLTNALAPIEGGYRARASRADVAAQAGLRLVIVSVGDGLVLVTSRRRKVVAVPAEHFRVVDIDGAGAVEILLPNGDPVVFEAVERSQWRFRRMTAASVGLALQPKPR